MGVAAEEEDEGDEGRHPPIENLVNKYSRLREKHKKWVEEKLRRVNKGDGGGEGKLRRM